MIPLQTEFTIDNRNFFTNHWSPTQVYKNLPRIGKYFAVPISMVVSSGDVDKLSDTIPTAVLYLFQEMEENDIMELFSLILKDTFLKTGAQPVADNLDEIFQANPEQILELVAKVLEVNYGNFFKKGGLNGLLKIVTPMVQAEELYP